MSGPNKRRVEGGEGADATADPERAAMERFRVLFEAGNVQPEAKREAEEVTEALRGEAGERLLGRLPPRFFQRLMEMRSAAKADFLKAIEAPDPAAVVEQQLRVFNEDVQQLMIFALPPDARPDALPSAEEMMKRADPLIRELKRAEPLIRALKRCGPPQPLE